MTVSTMWGSPLFLAPCVLPGGAGAPSRFLAPRRRWRGPGRGPRMDNASGGASPARPDKENEAAAVPDTLPDLRQLFVTAGDPDCGQCEGRGEIACPVCEAKGFVSLKMFDTVSTVQCRMCRGKIRIPCPSCRTEVYKSILWWDKIPKDDDEEKWRTAEDGTPRFPWTPPPA